MNVKQAATRMNIMISLSSLLLCESLHGLLEKDAARYCTMVIRHPEECVGFEPHTILVDAAVLKQVPPEQWGKARVVLIDTGLDDEEVIRLLFNHKLDGVISTLTDAELFKKALQTIHSGQMWIDHGKIRALLNNHPSTVNTPDQKSFSKRERQIVVLIAEGLRNREIATHLSISEQTVKAHLSRIFRKAAVANRAQLAPLALKFRVDSISPPLV